MQEMFIHMSLGQISCRCDRHIFLKNPWLGCVEVKKRISYVHVGVCIHIYIICICIYTIYIYVIICI